MNSLSISSTATLTPSSSLLISSSSSPPLLKLRTCFQSSPSKFSIQASLSASTTPISSSPNNKMETLTLDGGGFSEFLQSPLASQTNGARGPNTSDPMGLLLRERIIFLGNPIDDFVADAIISQLLLLDAQDPTKDIRLFINCPGGSLSSTMAIYDVVQLIRADVSTIALGIAASTASIVLGGGTKGKRFAMPNTRIMIHQPLGGISGHVRDVEVQAKEIMENKKNVINIVAGFTGRTLEQIEKDIDRDRYMSPMEAVEFGIIDGAIDKDSIIPLMPVPDTVDSRFGLQVVLEDESFLTPNIPDDELY